MVSPTNSTLFLLMFHIEPEGIAIIKLDQVLYSKYFLLITLNCGFSNRSETKASVTFVVLEENPHTPTNQSFSYIPVHGGTK
jgi:hypothetical protein